VGVRAGVAIDRTSHRLAGEVKAATAHGLRVGRAGGDWVVEATLDV
jgi:SHS2 domain-containing protein